MMRQFGNIFDNSMGTGKKRCVFYNEFVIIQRKTVNLRKNITMDTTVIEVRDDVAYGFLNQLERMNVLRIISRQRRQNGDGQKLSERFAGSLSSERVDELQQELNQMRSEWDRTI